MSNQQIVLDPDINNVISKDKELHDYLLDGMNFTKNLFNKLNDASVFNDTISNQLNIIKKGNNISTIVVVGCGGTGSWLMPKLVKTINDAERKGILSSYFKLILIDGDTVEEKNLIRQNFIPIDIGFNKAEVMANRYGGLINPAYETIFYDRYISTHEQNKNRPTHEKDMFIEVENIANSDNLSNYGDRIIFNLVDNMKARVAVHTMASLPFGDHVYGKTYVVDTGNDLYNGQFFVSEHSFISEHSFMPEGCNIGGKDFSASDCALSLDSYFGRNPNEILSDEDVSLYSCAEADVDESNQDQMLVANDFAATICHNWLINLCLSKINSSNIPVQKEASFICGTSSTMNTSEYHISILEYVLGFAIYSVFYSRKFYDKSLTELKELSSENMYSGHYDIVKDFFKLSDFDDIINFFTYTKFIDEETGELNENSYLYGGSPFYIFHSLIRLNISNPGHLDKKYLYSFFILIQEAIKEGIITSKP